MKINISTRIFKVLNLNTYNSILEPTDEYLCTDLDELINADLITEDEKESIESEVDMAFSMKAYFKQLAESAIEYIKKELDTSIFPFSVSVTGEANIDSPKFYNYEGDALIFEVEVPDNIAEILNQWIKDGNWNDKYMQKHFGSYDGFHSFMPYDIESALEVCSKPEHKDLDFLLAMIMDQILDSNLDTDDKEDFFMQFYDEWSGNGFDSYTNYLEGETPLFDRAMELYRTQI